MKRVVPDALQRRQPVERVVPRALQRRQWVERVVPTRFGVASGQSLKRMGTMRSTGSARPD